MKLFLRCIFICTLIGEARCTDTHTLHPDATDYLIGQILHVWSIINTARSIASHENAKLNNDIFAANLELYGKMYRVFHGQEEQFVDLEPVHAILAALRHNHDDLCDVQNEFDNTAIRKLMAAIWTLSQKFSSPSGNAPIMS